MKEEIMKEKRLTKGSIKFYEQLTELENPETICNHVEEILRNPEDKYRLLVESSTVMIFAVDTKGNFLCTNKAFKKNLGFSVEEIKKINGFKLVHPEDLATVEKQFAQLLEGKNVDNMEYRYKTKDGSYIHILNNASPIFDSNGNVIAALGIARDITRRKNMEKELQKTRDELELQVQKRTSELLATNKKLMREITQHRKAEESLSESEEKFRTIFQTVNDTITYVDKFGKILDINRKIEDLLGYKPEEIIGKNFAKLGVLGLKDIPQIVRLFRETIKKGEAQETVELELKHKNGNRVLVEVDTRFIKNNGKVEGVVNMFRDITERKRAEEALRESEGKLKSIIESVDDVIFRVSPLGIIKYVSPRVKEVYGYKPEELIGKHLKKTTPMNEVPKALEVLKKVLSGKTIKNFEINQLDSKGKIVHMEINVSPVKKEGKITAAQGVMRDITERKRAEEAMKESEEKFRNLAEQSPNMICINIGRQVVYVNKKCEEVVGYKKEEFYSPDFDFFTLIGSESVNKVKASYNMHMKGEEVSPYEFSLITKEGKRIDAIATTKLINYEGDSAVLGIVTDITEHKKAEEELKRAYKELKASQLQLIQSEKLAALGQLATGVAHEINNPLFVISAEAEMLWKDEDEDMNTKDASKVILEQAERINVITDGLLGFSRKRELKKEPLDVNDVLEKSTSLLDYQAKIEDIEIIKDLDPNLPKVHGDSSELQKTFLNIMLNAVQVMEKGGKLTVRTRKEKITKNERRKKDKFKLGEELVVVEFEDKGKGMDEETLAKIFDPFFSTKETGVGLGLSICHRIIENHRGVIEAHSKLGEGSIFIIKLPILE